MSLNIFIKDVISLIPNVVEGVFQWKSETENTKRNQVTLENETKQKEIEANQNIKEAELNSHNNIIDKNAEVSNNSIDKNAEVSKISIDSANELSHKVMDTSKDMIESISEDKKDIIEFSKENYGKLTQIQEVVQKAQMETAYYRTNEKIFSEISKNILTYAEDRSSIKEKIKHLELKLQSKKKQIKPEKKALEELKQNCKIEKSKYQDLNNNFTDVIYSIEKLAYEYKDAMEEKEYSKNIKREKRELEKYIDKIKSVELKLLNIEKEKLIIDKRLKPKLEEIESLEFSLEYLKNERDTNEFMGLLNLSNIQINNIPIENSQTHNEIIDTEIEDDKKIESESVNLTV